MFILLYNKNTFLEIHKINVIKNKTLEVE